MSESRAPDHAALLKRSLVAIDQLEARLATVERARREPIAVVGIGCRFPGQADNLESLWKLLLEGVDAVTEVPADRWDVESVYDPDPDAVGKTYTRWGGFLRDIDQFDAQFFGISPREAVSMDPQQRVLLEVTWDALEDAGIPPASLAGSDTAVYLGITTNDYPILLARSGRMREADAYTPSGTAHSMAAGRVSYVFGLHGPNVPIDTACSSSTVGLHWAVQSLRSAESSVALVGGVNLILAPEGSILTSRARMMSFTGRCKTFDASADGYVRSEGCAMMVLKRLSDAQRDGDRIIGLIVGSAVNQDGRTSGLTAPNGAAQVRVIRSALANAGLKPSDVGYVEAHGTGTSLGDPIEMKALGEVFRDRGASGPLMVSSIKANVGHTEATAGVAGVIKALLAMRHQTVSPHLHLRNPNPMIAWDELPIRVPTEATPWTSPDGVPRRAGASSFGFSGTNAHVVLEEAPPRTHREEADEGRPQLLAISAEGPKALQVLAGRYADQLARPGGASLRAVARSAAVGRAHLTERMAVVASSGPDAVARLRAFAAGESPPGIARGTASSGVAPELVFMFTGQGAQGVGMGMGLYATQPAYREALDECARLLAPHLERPLLDVLQGKGDAAALDDTRYTQPALFALEYALAQLWRSWGVEPTAVLGHSVGEYVAACIAGVFSLEDATRLIAHRARLMAGLPREGGMAAVFCDEARVQAALVGEPRVAIAGINGAQSIVVSGASDALERVLAKLVAQGIEAQRLKVSHAFHSPLMDPILDEFEKVASGVRFSPPRIGLVSNVSGRSAGGEICTPAYWRRHLREAVRFGQSLGTLAHDGFRVFLEIGPHPVLCGMAQREETMAGAALVASLRRGRDDEASMLEALAQLHVRGTPLRPSALWGEDAARDRVELPRYPFQRRRYWLDFGPRAEQSALAPTRGGHPLLGGTVASPLNLYQAEIGLAAHPWLADHRIFDFTPLPAAAFLELALAAGREALGQDAICLRNLVIREPLMLPEEGTVTMQAIVTPDSNARQTVQLFSREGEGAPWRAHAAATVEPTADPVPPPQPKGANPPAQSLSATDFYATLGALGQAYGPTFRGITEIHRAGDEMLGHIVLPEAVAGGASRMLVHPALMDACLQLMGVPMLGELDPAQVPAALERYLPVGVERYRVYRPGVAQAWCRVRMVESGDPNLLRSDMTLFDDAGTVVAELEGVEMRRITQESLMRAGTTPSAADWCFEVQWQAAALDAATAVRPAGGWLVLCDVGALGEGLADRLRAGGASVTCVRAAPGATYKRTGDGVLMDADERAQWQRLLGESGELKGIVSLWPLDAIAPIDEERSIDAVLPAALARMLHTAHALADVPARLWIVTRGSQAVAGSIADPLQASLWGLAGVIDSEYPALACVRVDLDPVAPDAEAERLYETLSHPDEERRVAWRGEGRLVARLRPHVLAAQPAAPIIRGDATYLVTGGLGGLGLASAEWLAAEGARHLALVGRRAPQAEAEAAIARLREQGVAVYVAQADVADAAGLGAVLQHVGAQMPPLRGILHSAGSVDDGMLSELDMARFATVMAPKVRGSWNLHRQTSALPLDFFVLYSSGAGLLGAPGQGNYAAANSFMDGLAHRRRASGLAALSVNWGSWSQVGMAATVSEQHHRRWAAMGLKTIAPAEGLKMLRDMMHGTQAPQLAAIPLVRSRLPAQSGPFFADLRIAPRAQPAVQAASSADVSRQVEQANAGARLAVLQGFLADELVKVLALGAGTRIDVERSIMEMGLDSLMAMELRNRIHASVGVRVSVADLLRGPSVVQLSTELLAGMKLAGAKEGAGGESKAQSEAAWEEGSL